MFLSSTPSKRLPCLSQGEQLSELKAAALEAAANAIAITDREGIIV
jgi:hypothetical protein